MVDCDETIIVVSIHNNYTQMKKKSEKKVSVFFSVRCFAYSPAAPSIPPFAPQMRINHPRFFGLCGDD
jgi:hypothetical protein